MDGTNDALGDLDEALLARCAWLYYNDGLTQNEIGAQLNISRIKVSRLLEQGRISGLIQVRINSRHQGCLELEETLRARFGLGDCRVIPDAPADDLNERIGQAAAQYLMQHLAPDSLLAVGWGATVTHSIRMLGHVARQRGVGLVSLTGGVRTYVDGMGMANWDRNIHVIPAPLVVADPDLATALMREPSVARLMDMALNADFKLVGIGELSEGATVVAQGYLSRDEVEPLRRRGAVGDVLCRLYDEAGQTLDLPLHRRVVGVDLAQLGGTEKVIGAAGGRAKSKAIGAALRGRLLDILITDETTARLVLEQPGEGA
ncbi:sugar-binding transcriptional regulator [Limimaricola pyoseonensis]|uniref:Transcriptional regulator, DeoR family n=1 Tax=Limimaricola pyoseonensis TaxID=521013 RepID=A0A1G7ILB2_9RHOB|nr:sugar-binding transcriptional regulator [Limimaricola pyoseonensis]SDF13405.1 transcriptional regulator, DeoR family [Limimaricola pyoseonensis]